MKPRRIQLELERRLAEVPAVVLLGPRQVGKTTLALAVAEKRDALYLDLESEADRAKLAEPELYLSGHLDRLVVLDEVHRTPGLFPVLRGLIDRARRAGRRHGLYLLLGSAALDLLRQSGETLAGRVSYLALDPFDVLEVGDTPTALDRLWLRGGFPESFLAADDGASLRWREDFIRTYLERDIPQFGPTHRRRPSAPAVDHARAPAGAACSTSPSSLATWAWTPRPRPATSTCSSTSCSCAGCRRGMPTWASGWCARPRSTCATAAWSMRCSPCVTARHCSRIPSSARAGKAS